MQVQSWRVCTDLWGCFECGNNGSGEDDDKLSEEDEDREATGDNNGESDFDDDRELGGINNSDKDE